MSSVPTLQRTGLRFTYRDYLSTMMMTRGSRLRHAIPATASKYPLSTLLQGVAAAVLHHLFQQASYCLNPTHQTVEFRELSPRQLLPAF